MKDIARSLFVWYLAVAAGVAALASLAQADPKPGEVFRVYNAYVVPNGRIIALDPNCTAFYCQGNETVTKYVGLDLTDAVRAEMMVEMWGGHIGSKKAVVINNNPQLELAKPNTPGTPECYFSTFNGVSMAIPLNYLKTGANAYYFKAWPVGSCKSEGYPGWYWVYSVRFIIYYTPSRLAHPTGSITSPETGASIGDYSMITAEASSPNSTVREVLFVGYYNDFDWEGNGQYRQWHLGYKYGTVVNKIGQKTGLPYEVQWNTKWVPDQSGMQIAARITDAKGVSYMTPAVTNIAFDRTRPVKMYKPSNVPTMFCGAKNKTCTISVPDNLADAVSAKMMVSTWAGNGDDRQIKINGVLVPGVYGFYHTRHIAQLNVPLSAVKTGTNNISIVGKISGEHSFEINWPGPVLFIEYKDTAPQTGMTARAAYLPPVSATPNPLSVPGMIVPGPGLSDASRIAIHTLGGRPVRSLPAGSPGGSFWDGRNTNGKAVAAGMYLISFTTGTGLVTQRIMVIR